MNLEKVYFKATDNLELVGLLHKGNMETKKIIISLHGMTSNCLKKREDVIAKYATKQGIDYFVFAKKQCVPEKLIAEAEAFWNEFMAENKKEGKKMMKKGNKKFKN